MASRELDDPVLERRRLAALTQIRQFGDPVLRTPTVEVTAFDETLRDDVERMAAIMRDAAGVGLAAPQVGSLRRLMVLRPDGEDVAEEGCLSLGEITVEVSRPVAVRVEAQDLAGKPLELEPEGFEARVIQHEIDHLDGVLILDRTTPEQRREALRALRNGG